MIPAHKNLKNPPGQIVNPIPEPKPNLYKWPSFDRYPWLKTGGSKAPISPAKRLGDIIDAVVARSSEPASKGTYEQGYKDGWDAAIAASYLQQLKDF